MNEKISALSKAKKRLQVFSIFFVVCGIVIIFLLSSRPIGGLILTLALLAIYLLLFRRQVKDYRQAVKQAMLEEGLRPFIKNIAYERKDGISADTFLQMRFLPNENPKSLIIRDTIHGTYQAMPVFLTDITTDITSAKSAPDYLSGCLLDIQLRSGNDDDYMLWPKKLLQDKDLKHYFSGMTEAPAPGLLADTFLLYRRSGTELLAISPEAEKSILRLCEYTPGNVCIQVSAGHLRIFIGSRFLFTLHIPGQTEITAKILSSNPFQELPYLLRIYDAF